MLSSVAVLRYKIKNLKSKFKIYTTCKKIKCTLAEYIMLLYILIEHVTIVHLIAEYI